jgi:hypothetical protein
LNTVRSFIKFAEETSDLCPRSKKFFDLLALAGSDQRKFPATELYREGWLLRLILDWFSKNQVDGHPLNFALHSGWYSEARLPSRFLARKRIDDFAEGWTHADGVIGHFEIDHASHARLNLAPEAEQFVVIEAKLFSPLSPGVTKAKYFDQAARSVACIAEVLFQANDPG